ncbi:expressed protein [Phakopsora pachyrhizi]|uniref:Expressed protein n=1 Tax=Phakopsora pachyrhizi TaxID=170000 RepID=A0AAV0BGX0_PHAPC|nr:expressed protein [Phakopsora pachyrhizi]
MRQNIQSKLIIWNVQGQEGLLHSSNYCYFQEFAAAKSMLAIVKHLSWIQLFWLLLSQLISSTTNPCCVPTRTENKTEEDSHPGVDILSFPGSNGGVQLPSPNPQLPLPEVSSGSSTAQGTSDKNYGQTISPDKLPPPPPPTPSPLSIPSPEPDVTTTNISPVGYTTPSAPPSNSPINPTVVQNPTSNGPQQNNSTSFDDKLKVGIIVGSIVLIILLIGGIAAFIFSRKKRSIETNDSPPVEEEPELPSYRRPETPPVSEFGRRGTVMFGRGLESGYNLSGSAGWIDTQPPRPSRLNSQLRRSSISSFSTQSISLDTNFSENRGLKPR